VPEGENGVVGGVLLPPVAKLVDPGQEVAYLDLRVEDPQVLLDGRAAIVGHVGGPCSWLELGFSCMAGSPIGWDGSSCGGV
jgi:hypothetical protein